MASLGIWLLGFGGSPNTEFVQQTAEQFSLGGTPDWAVTAMFVVLTGTTSMLTGVAAAARRGNRAGAASWCRSWHVRCRSPGSRWWSRPCSGSSVGHC
ncbi:hypothetical protein ABQF33_18105 [Mycolicibacterium sp. XJ2]